VLRPHDRAPADYTDADYSISAETARRLLNRHPDNTKRAYDRNWDQFSKWCRAEGRIDLPATAQTLADYVVRLIGISLAPVSIEQAIGTIRSVHADAGHKSQPDTTHPLSLLRAYKREWADAGGRTRKATPILIDALRAMVDTCDTTPAGLRDRSLLLLGFNGMFRRSELSRLDLGDIRDAGDEGVNIFVSRSKTDKDARGSEVCIPYGQHTETCAVRATRAWMDVLAEHGLTTGALYRGIDRHGRIGGEAKASGRVSDRLTGDSVSTIVHRRAVLAGLPEPGGYSGHSLRSGGATSAYLAGAPVSEIARHGRWSENSPVVLGYIRAVDKWKNNPMKGIGL
jgi:integrase